MTPQQLVQINLPSNIRDNPEQPEVDIIVHCFTCKKSWLDDHTFSGAIGFIIDHKDHVTQLQVISTAYENK